MDTKFVEVHNNEQNWGKFMLCRFTADEWAQRSEVTGASLLATTGWSAEHLLIVDLQTGEGAIMRHGGVASADLDKHRVWVCPMFEPFLEWLWERKPLDWDSIPALLNLPDAPFSFAGYRRKGTTDDIIERCEKAGIDHERLRRVLDGGDNWGKLVHGFEALTVLEAVASAMAERAAV